MPGQTDRFVVDPFHQAAITGDNPCLVIDQLIAEVCVQMPLCKRHTYRSSEPLAQRAGRRLNAFQLEIFRMPGARRTELTERPDVFHRRALIAGQMEQRIDQHRTMTGRQHEPVAICPFRGLGIIFQIVAEQHRGHVRHPHRHPRMAAVGSLYRIHGERSDGVCHVLFGNGHDWSDPPDWQCKHATKCRDSLFCLLL